MKINKCRYLIIIIFLACILGGDVVFSETPDITINPILPKNQVSESVTYYNLKVTPNQKQELEVDLYNPSNKKLKVDMTLTNATTSNYGEIDYSETNKNKKKDTTLSMGITDMAQIPNQVVIPPQTSKKIKIKLDIPKESFEGVKMGAIRFYPSTVDSKKTKEKKKNESFIKNKTVYTVGIVLNESNEPVIPSLDLLRVYPSQTNGHNVIKANIQNKTPIPLEGLTYTGTIRKKGRDTVLHSTKRTDYRFAPNSNFDYEVEWKNTPFQAGKYVMTVKVVSSQTVQKWEWEKEFELSEDEAKLLNKTSIDLESKSNIPKIVLSIVVILLLSCLAYVGYKVVLKNKKSGSEKKPK